VHVLVVDDDEDSLYVLQAYLSHHGALVTVAGDAAQALVALHRVRVHVIVSDLSMPGMDGHELLLRTRKLPGELTRPTPAIAVTAFDSAEHRRRARDVGFDAYLAKPLDPDALVQAIARLVPVAGAS
jgi:CheY-like chemotaxis protein